jgi:hypothetical protein
LIVDCWLLIVDCWLLIVDCWLLIVVLHLRMLAGLAVISRGVSQKQGYRFHSRVEVRVEFPS